MPERFSMAVLRGANYLHLRHLFPADHPLSLLHIRYFSDERKSIGWNDSDEDRPITCSTALGALTLHRWRTDVVRNGANIRRLPTRAELLTKLKNQKPQVSQSSSAARLLLRRIPRLQPGTAHATEYQHWVRDVMTFLFGDILKEPKIESKTFFDTLRRDITFRNAAEKGPWFDWKLQYRIDPLLIECKNKDQLTYNDLRQTAAYLGKRMGTLAILACRKNSGTDVLELLNWFVNNDEKYVLVLNDRDLIDWIRLKDTGEDPAEAIADVYRSLREGAQ